MIGRLGADMTTEAGYEAARLVGLGILASLRKQFGTLERIRRVVKVLGVVNSTPDLRTSRGDQRLQRAIRSDLLARRRHRGPQRLPPPRCPWAWPWRSRRFLRLRGKRRTIEDQLYTCRSRNRGGMECAPFVKCSRVSGASLLFSESKIPLNATGVASDPTVGVDEMLTN